MSQHYAQQYYLSRVEVLTKLLSTSDLVLHPPLALVPFSFWHFASMTGSEPAESRLGLTRCLCLSHGELER